MQRHAVGRAEGPIFALHAKTMVIDDRAVYIGTYNLDPRSENLNTEVGVVIHDSRQAAAVANSIATDMLPANSWNAAADDPDQFADLAKRDGQILDFLAPSSSSNRRKRSDSQRRLRRRSARPRKDAVSRRGIRRTV